MGTVRKAHRRLSLRGNDPFHEGMNATVVGKRPRVVKLMREGFARA